MLKRFAETRSFLLVAMKRVKEAQSV